jgi:hypothetical protein
MSRAPGFLGYIGELCIALAHRWEPERLFVILTAYFDEADTHGAAPTVILSAFLGDALGWQRFEKKLAKIQRKFGFKIFHAKDFKGRDGEFSGWSVAKCVQLNDALIKLVRETLIAGISVHLERDRYLNEYRSEPFPKKLHKDSQYGVCFRGCLGAMLKIMADRGNQDRLNIVMEDGHTNVWDCERIYKDLKKRFRRVGEDHLLGSWTVETKASCPPLMVADMLAGTHSMMRAGLEDGSVHPSQIHQAHPGQKGALWFVELAPNSLQGLKDGFVELQRREIAERHTASRVLKNVAAER